MVLRIKSSKMLWISSAVVTMYFVVASTTRVSTNARSHGQQGQRTISWDQMAQQRAALRRGGLNAAASITGTYVGPTGFDADGPTDLDELVSVSDVVLVGSVIDNVCVLHKDHRSISTVYTVSTDTPLKGDTSGLPLDVVVPGGKVGFPDGTTAEVTTPGFVRPMNGRRYVWFLGAARDAAEIRAGGRLYAPIAGPLGIYPLDRPGHIRTSGAFGTILSRSIVAENLLEADFISEIRRLAAR
jgi:hypothetical protein